MKRKRVKSTSSRADIRIVVAVVAVVMLAAGIFIGNSISGYYTYRIDTDMANVASLSTDGFSEVDISTKTSLIYLTAGCRRMSIETTPEQTNSIELALRGMESLRPNAHDLMYIQMKVFGVEFLMAKVHTLEDGVYYADLILKQDNRVLTMDARPSDAIALATRARVPVYVSDSLMEEEGKAAC